MEAGLKERTVNNLFWKFLDQFFTQGVSTVVAVVLARILMPSDYGVVSAALIFINICNTFATEGFASALIQKKDADQLDFCSIFYSALVLLTALYALLFFSAPYISAFFGEGYELLTPILRVLCLRIPLSALNVIQQAYVSRHLMFKRLFWISSTGTLASAFIGLGMALCGLGPWALVGQYLSDIVIDTVIFAVTIRWRPALCYSWQRTRKMLSFSVNLLAASLLDTVFDDLRNIIIGHRYQSSALAFFDKGKRLPHALVNSVNSSFMTVLYPVMTRIQEDPARVREVVRKAVKAGTYVLFPCMFGLAAVAEPFVTLLLTEKWLPCVPYVRIFCFFYAFYPAYTASLQATKALGRSGIYVLTQTAKKAVDLLCLIIAAPFGVYWIAVGALASKFFVYIINGVSANIALGYSLRRQVLDILPNLLLSAVMYAAASLLPVPGGGSLVILTARVLTGCAVYLALSIATKNESFFVLWDMLRKKAAKLPLPHIRSAARAWLRAIRAPRRYSSCLTPGRYRVNPARTVIYREDLQDAEARESAFLYQTKDAGSSASLLARLTSKLYRVQVKTCGTDFHGQLLLLTTTGRAAKIFDCEARKIATVYEDPREAEAVLENRSYWSAYFPVVPFEPALRGGRMLVESMIEKQPYDAERGFLALFPPYLRYLNAQREREAFTRKSFDPQQLTRFLDLLGRPEDREALAPLLELPALRTHGDLWTSNLLYDGETFYHIDFEAAAIRTFFFDPLMYLFSDAYLNKHPALLNNYCQGKYDAPLEEFFRAANREYQRSHRLLYLEAVLFQLFAERWDRGGPSRVMADLRTLMASYSLSGDSPAAPSHKAPPKQAPLPTALSVAIVGVDGTGKSTLVESLARHYGPLAHVQYMGFHSYTTAPAKLFHWLHQHRFPFGQLHLYTPLYMLTSWHEMKTRLRRARRHKEQLLLFDRYAWEASDNAVSPVAVRLSRFLFHRHFPSPTGLIYLYCPTEISLQRKTDISDPAEFARMKEHTDQLYISRPGTLVLDTHTHTAEQVKALALEYINNLSDGRYQ